MLAQHHSLRDSIPTRTSCAVAVIGAGISGLSAARWLADRAFNVHVYDKGRSVGGRTAVRREGDLQFDHGAQYFTAQDEEFVEQVRVWMKAGVVQEWHGSIASIENGQVTPRKERTRYVCVPGMNALAKYLARSLKVVCNTQVTSIRYHNKQWFLFGDKGQQCGYGDALIIALPAEQSARLCTELPVLSQQLRMCVFDPCWSCNTSSSFSNVFRKARSSAFVAAADKASRKAAGQSDSM